MVIATIKKVLTIAGSDCSGGAGIQADIKTITAHKMYAMSVITALTAQNTTGVYGILEATPEFIKQQIDCIFTDIFPDAVKVGMVFSSPIIEVIAERLSHYRPAFTVIDPVMVSATGCKLISEEAMEALIAKLLPLGTVITPNIPEASVLCGFPIDSETKMLEAAQKIAERTETAVLIKGGHLEQEASDLLFMNGRALWYRTPRISTPNTHGTGCTLSSAIACNLATGRSLEESVGRAKRYLTGALQAGLDLGKGSGPLDHTYWLSLPKEES